MQIADIRAAFEATLRSYATPKKIPIAFENLDFKPEAPLWLECFLLPAETVAQTNNSTKSSGIFQVNLYTQQNEYTTQADVVAAEIMALFPWGGKTGNLTHSPPVSRSRGFRVDGFYCVAVSVHYTSL